MAETSDEWSDEELSIIREQLSRILQSSLFAQADRQSRFLQYVVDATLVGHAKRLNQYLLGIDVFDRDETFDPAIDSAVRVEAGRLRSKLRDYYIEFGQKDPVIIELPKGGYSVQIKTISSEDKSSRSTSVSQNEQKTVHPEEKPSIAILPFDNLSGDSEQEYFSDGITEDIITDLSKLSGLLVIARHSNFDYKGKSLNIKEIGNDLGVNYLLEGSVRKAGTRLRITAQLIDAVTGNHLWAERFDRELDDIFEIQDEVSKKIVRALEVKLTHNEKIRLGHKGTENIDSHDFLLRGQEQLYLFTPEGVNNAINLFSKAISCDPKYANAYAWKARSVLFPYIAGTNSSEEETVLPALELAIKAVELDDLLPHSHAILGWSLKWDKKINEAIIEAEKAVELDPNYSNGYMFQSMVLSSAGKGEEALASIEKGISINPYYNVVYILALGTAYFVLGKYEQALYHFKRGIERNPNFIPNHLYTASILGLFGDEDTAKQAMNTLQNVNPDYKSSASYVFFTDNRLSKIMLEGAHKAGLEITAFS